MEKERVIEIFLAMILFITLIILVFLFTNISATEKSTTSISNSYNTNSYNTYATNPPHYTSTHTNCYYIQKYKYDYPYNYDEKRYLVYSDRKKHERLEGVFGNEINKYKVYVTNKDHKEGYFTVKFYFYDYYGRITSESVSHYIKPHQEKIFFYQRIYNGDYEYYKWNYEVLSKTKVPNRYYEDDSIRFVRYNEKICY